MLKTDIRDFVPSETPDMVVIDVSFISLRQILPHVAKIINKNTTIVAMVLIYSPYLILLF